MWHCSNCNEKIADTFDACWKCGTNREGIITDDFAPVADDPSIPDPGPSDDDLQEYRPDDFPEGDRQPHSHQFNIKKLPISKYLRIIGCTLLLIPFISFFLACMGLEWPIIYVFFMAAQILKPILPQWAYVLTHAAGPMLSPPGIALVFFAPGIFFLSLGSIVPLYMATQPDKVDGKDKTLNTNIDRPAP
jgi:hypothetical protein